MPRTQTRHRSGKLTVQSVMRSRFDYVRPRESTFNHNLLPARRIVPNERSSETVSLERRKGVNTYSVLERC